MAMQQLQKIKNWVHSQIGQEVSLVAYAGRRKRLRAKGIFERAYLHIFTIRLQDQTCAAFSYGDVLTGHVVLKKTKQEITQQIS